VGRGGRNIRKKRKGGGFKFKNGGSRRRRLFGKKKRHGVSQKEILPTLGEDPSTLRELKTRLYGQRKNGKWCGGGVGRKQTQILVKNIISSFH